MFNYAFEANDKGMFYKDAIKNDKDSHQNSLKKRLMQYSQPEKHLGACTCNELVM